MNERIEQASKHRWQPVSWNTCSAFLHHNRPAVESDSEFLYAGEGLAPTVSSHPGHSVQMSYSFTVNKSAPLPPLTCYYRHPHISTSDMSTAINSDLILYAKSVILDHKHARSVHKIHHIHL